MHILFVRWSRDFLQNPEIPILKILRNNGVILGTRYPYSWRGGDRSCMYIDKNGMRAGDSTLAADTHDYTCPSHKAHKSGFVILAT